MADTTPAAPPKKPWYKSKIILLALSSLMLFGSNWLTGWLTSQGVSQEQLDALSQAQPQVTDVVQRVQGGESILSVLGAIISIAILIFRTWFTDKAIGKP